MKRCVRNKINQIVLQASLKKGLFVFKKTLPEIFIIYFFVKNIISDCKLERVRFIAIDFSRMISENISGLFY